MHELRNLMAKQCYVGIVGLQGAGKTTLLNKLWGLEDNTGHFTHTSVPEIHEVDKRLLVVDFPGSDSLDYHAKAFSVCGAMNNLIVLVVPYGGDVSKVHSKAIADAFSVMAGAADSSDVVLCVNKCVQNELPKAILKELGDEEDPVDSLRQRFADRVNEHYRKEGRNFAVDKRSILFTDWMDGDREDVAALGISGVNAVRGRIREYLVRHLIFAGPDEDERLDGCLVPRPPKKKKA